MPYTAMEDINLGASNRTHPKAPSTSGSSKLPDGQGKQMFNSDTVQTRNTMLEDGINSANEKHRPMVDIQEYFVRAKFNAMS
jgi:hypothetical protein